MERKSINAGHRLRLRERFVSVGLRGFSEHETIELLLTLCIPRKDVKILAKNILNEFGSVSNFLSADIARIQNIQNIGSVAPIAIKFIKELSLIFAENKMMQNESFLDIKETKAFWVKKFHGLTTEVFDIALLDAKYQLVSGGICRISEGSKTLINLHPRQIIELVIKYGASHVVLAHNHIVGPASPSDQDERLTRLIKTTLLALETSVIDHIIVGPNEVFSFREKFLL